jgi:hypothetical protein
LPRKSYSHKASRSEIAAADLEMPATERPPAPFGWHRSERAIRRVVYFLAKLDCVTSRSGRERTSGDPPGPGIQGRRRAGRVVGEGTGWVAKVVSVQVMDEDRVLMAKWQWYNPAGY